MRWTSWKWLRRQRRLKRQQHLADWHQHYCWRPVFVHERRHGGMCIPAHWVWLEPVARRLHDDYMGWGVIMRSLTTFFSWFGPSTKWHFKEASGNEPETPEHVLSQEDIPCHHCGCHFS